MTRGSLLILNLVCFASFVVKFDCLFVAAQQRQASVVNIPWREKCFRYLTRFPCNQEEDELGEGPCIDDIQIRNSKSEIRNNFKWPKIRKFQTNSEGRAASGEKRVSRSRFQVSDFRVSDLELRISVFCSCLFRISIFEFRILNP